MSLNTKPLVYKKPGPLNICTLTICSKISNNSTTSCIDLHLLSRCIEIKKPDSLEANSKEGCIIGLMDFTEHKYTDISRGILNKKKLFSPNLFNNQLTVVYKYHGFKQINVKIFSQNKLQLTGIKDYPVECKNITSYITSILNNIKYKIYLDKCDFRDIETNDYVLYYDETKDEIIYYRKNYDLYNIVDYLFNKNIEKTSTWMKDDDCKKILNNRLKELEKYKTLLSKSKDLLLDNNDMTLDMKIQFVKNLSVFNKIKKNKENIIYQMYSKFKKHYLDYIKLITKSLKRYEFHLTQTNYTDNFVIEKLYHLYPNINNDIKKYIEINGKISCYILPMEINDYNFQYFNETIDMIKCKFQTHMGYKLRLFSKLLMDDYKIFNTYNPNDSHAGILAKYFYNPLYINDNTKKKGKCYCETFCNNKKKRTDISCSIITIIIFRLSNIIIAGAKTFQEIESAYNFINNVIKDNYDKICYHIDDNELKNNIKKKIIKSEPLFIKKSSIIYN